MNQQYRPKLHQSSIHDELNDLEVDGQPSFAPKTLINEIFRIFCFKIDFIVNPQYIESIGKTLENNERITITPGENKISYYILPEFKKIWDQVHQYQDNNPNVEKNTTPDEFTIDIVHEIILNNLFSMRIPYAFKAGITQDHLTNRMIISSNLVGFFGNNKDSKRILHLRTGSSCYIDSLIPLACEAVNQINAGEYDKNKILNHILQIKNKKISRNHNLLLHITEHYNNLMNTMSKHNNIIELDSESNSPHNMNGPVHTNMEHITECFHHIIDLLISNINPSLHILFFSKLQYANILVPKIRKNFQDSSSPSMKLYGRKLGGEKDYFYGFYYAAYLSILMTEKASKKDFAMDNEMLQLIPKIHKDALWIIASNVQFIRFLDEELIKTILNNKIKAPKRFQQSQIKLKEYNIKDEENHVYTSDIKDLQFIVKQGWYIQESPNRVYSMECAIINIAENIAEKIKTTPNGGVVIEKEIRHQILTTLFERLNQNDKDTTIRFTQNIIESSNIQSDVKEIFKEIITLLQSNNIASDAQTTLVHNSQSPTKKHNNYTIKKRRAIKRIK